MKILIIFLVTNFILVVASIAMYRIGIKDSVFENKKISAIIPSSVFGLLALIMGFTFSMAISRYENRRELAVQEGNAISTAYLRSKLINKVPGVDTKQLYSKYVLKRIEYYDNNMSEQNKAEADAVELELWNHLQVIIRSSKTVIESNYMVALNQMFDTGNARNIALTKTLPLPIYGIIMLIAVIGFGTMNFDRGYNGESVHLGTYVFIALFSLLFTLVYDIDHAREGLITIGQDALMGAARLIASY